MERFDGIQVARGLAALLVVFQHSRLCIKYFDHPFWTYNRGSNFLYLNNLYVGVDIFFCISGFIMCMLLSRTNKGLNKAIKFFVDRVVRIYPPYWVVTLIIVVAYMASHGHLNMAHLSGVLSIDITRLAFSLGLIPFGDVPVLGVGWTLMHEMQFYVICSIAIAFGFQKHLPFVLLLISIVAFSLFISGYSLLNGYVLSPFNVEFLIGALVFKFRDKISYRIALGSAAGTLICYLVVSYILSCQIDNFSIDFVRFTGFPIVAGTFVMSAYKLAQKTGERNSLKMLGDSSFSLYLIHWLVLSFAGKLVGSFHRIGTLGQIAWWLGCISASVVVAVVLSRTLEMPCHAWLQKKARDAFGTTKIADDFSSGPAKPEFR